MKSVVSKEIRKITAQIIKKKQFLKRVKYSMVERQIVIEWISKPDGDFEFASINLRGGKIFFAQICFHFQQAAEKYLKAFIVANELDFRKIHDLPLLLKICPSKDPSLEILSDDCEYLAPFYIDARYPVHWPTNFSLQETQKALHSASRIGSLIKQKLKDFL
jgi:HEPN domain-containing protein